MDLRVRHPRDPAVRFAAWPKFVGIDAAAVIAIPVMHGRQALAKDAIWLG